MRIRPLIKADDMWVGVYRDRTRRRWYVCLLPCLGFVLDLAAGTEPVDGYMAKATRDDLIQALWLHTTHHTETQLATPERELLYDICCPGADRWWRCGCCDHPALVHPPHIVHPGGIGWGPCLACSCRGYIERPLPTAAFDR